MPSRQYLGALAAIAILILSASTPACFQVATHHTDVTVGEAVNLARRGQIQKIRVQDQEFTLILRDGTRRIGRIAPDENLRDKLIQAGVPNVDRLFSDP